MTKYRLAAGGRIDRMTTLTFTFDGKKYTGFEGDSLSSALLANGVDIVCRSFKYHRPRGVMSAGTEEAAAIVQVGEGAFEEPNVKTPMMPLYNGLVASSVNGWPNASRDVMAVLGLASPLLVAGFYYKIFKWPSWKLFSPLVRKMAGLGTLPKQNDIDTYARRNAQCDLLVVGGGPAGLNAALRAGEAGEDVVLVDEHLELGGSLLSSNGAEQAGWLIEQLSALKDLPNVRLMVATTATGYYDHNLIGLSQRLHTSHYTKADGVRERFWKVRAGKVLIATGAIERPLVFPNNDRPGIMLASAMRTYVNRFGVTPGKRVLLATNNDTAYQTALDLQDVGVKVEGVVDARKNPQGDLPKQLRERGMIIYAGQVVIGTKGRRRLKSVTIAPIDLETYTLGPSAQTIVCDALGTSGGWQPTVHLHSQSGGKLRYDDKQHCFVPSKYVQNNNCIGAADGVLSSMQAMGSDDTIKEEPLAPLWDLPLNREDVKKGKRFVDLLHDVTANDVRLAARENYRSVEHFKRYTTTGMAPDQGKTSNVNGLAILGQATDRTVAEVGTTKFRPPYTPVTMGAITGRDRGKLLAPIKYLTAHAWHSANGAVMEEYASWMRPLVYQQSGESEHSAIDREVESVRTAVGLLDYSPLGKIDIKGSDAAEFLNRFYVNNVKTLKVGRARYGLMLDEHGCVIDDGIFSCIADDHYWVTSTSGSAAARVAFFNEWRQCEWPDLDVVITGITTGWGTISIQGPNGRELLQRLNTDIDLSKVAFPHMAVRTGIIEGVPTRILRTSFTGELGYEVNLPLRYTQSLWERLMAVGHDLGITPFGLEALNVMRTEKGYIHVGMDTDSTTIPDDIGFGRVARNKKTDYVGRRSLYRPDAMRADREVLVGLKSLDGRVLPMGGMIMAEGYDTAPAPMIGRVTSSYSSPTLGHPVALGLLKFGADRMGDRIKIYDLDGIFEAEVVQPVSYDPKGERLNV